MEQSTPVFKKYVFVCEHERESGDFCGLAGSKIREILKNTIKNLGFSAQIRVSKSGCLDVCAKGPNVLIVPDYVWFSKVSEQDIPSIVEFVTKGLK